MLLGGRSSLAKPRRRVIVAERLEVLDTPTMIPSQTSDAGFKMRGFGVQGFRGVGSLGLKV